MARIRHIGPFWIAVHSWKDIYVCTSDPVKVECEPVFNLRGFQIWAKKHEA